MRTVGRLVLIGAKLIGISVLVFLLAHLLPGDPAAALLGTRASPERVARLRAALGLDVPWPVQLLHQVTGLLRGDLGTSTGSGEPVTQEITDRLPATAALVAVALVFAVVAGVTVGAVAARGGRPAWDVVVATGLATPVLWVAPAVLALGGYGVTRTVLAPALCVAVAPAAVVARITRSAVLTASRQPHILAATGRGVPPARLLLRHLLPHATAPVATLTSLLAGSLVMGTAVVETVFARPGLGRLGVEAVLARDVPVVHGVVVVAAAGYLLLTLAADLLAERVDPRLVAG